MQTSVPQHWLLAVQVLDPASRGTQQAPPLQTAAPEQLAPQVPQLDVSTLMSVQTPLQAVGADVGHSHRLRPEASFGPQVPEAQSPGFRQIAPSGRRDAASACPPPVKPAMSVPMAAAITRRRDG